MINKLEELIDKLIECKKNHNQECSFNEEDKEFIYNLRIDLLPEDEFQLKLNKLIYLLCNVKNNLEPVYLENLKSFLSMMNVYFEDESIEQYNYFGLNIKYLKEELKWRNKILTFKQKAILQSFYDHNVILKAGTGAGKTFLSSYFLVERYIEHIKHNKNSNEKFVFIVPTEILEDQIIRNLTYEFESEISSGVIGKSIIENDILIITCEKLISHINIKAVDIKINTLIIDEAHLLLSNNDLRSEFMQHTLKQYFQNGQKIQKIIFMSPFDLDADEIKNKISLDIESNNFLFAHLGSNYRCNKINFNDKEIKRNNDSDHFDQYIFDNTDSVICVYANTKSRAKFIAKKWSEKNEYVERIKIEQINELGKEKVDLILNELNSFEYNNYQKYVNFKYIKKGICYLTSDIPDAIKHKIISLVNDRYIRLVVATSLIVAGVDLPFDMTLMDSYKVNDKIMSNNDINNFFGRAGRINNYKKAYGGGFSYIKLSKKKDNEWWNKNREEIMSKLNSSEQHFDYSSEQKVNDFINKSYEMFEKTKDPKYLLDPRVNPKTTEFIEQLANNDNYLFLFDTFVYKMKNKTKMNEKNVLIFMHMYSFWEYTNNVYENSINIDEFKKWFENKRFDESIISEEYLNQISWNLNWYIKYDFNIESALNQFLPWEYKKYDENKFTKNVEKFIDINKTYGKHLLVLFFNHFWLLIKEPKYTNISTYFTYYVTNYDFYTFIKENDYSKFILQIVNHENSNLLSLWQTINSIDNDIKKIFNELKEIIDGNMKKLDWLINEKDISLLKKLLEKEPNFITDLEKFIKDKNL